MREEKNELLEWLKAFLIAIVLAVVVRHFILTPIVVDGSSMMPTLHDRDRMIVNKLQYSLKEPKRFDIIVFHTNDNKNLIKRIIGLPGDRIEYKDDVLYINGKAYKEPYLDEYKKQNVLDVPFTYSFTLKDTPIGNDIVPEGHLFVMGDNRGHSTDSRHIGAIPIEEVYGSAKIKYWPFKHFQVVK
ncbi:signal peptidase I [Bacillus sp. FJAT-49732]|uniref:Signal peptidase I n=1 Tax=Lederbergia citrisecunda TaxID=2833583 RepID=A0A942TKT6_9BACI|nr:signal peptidase I [Lederbergia citrisecunda]MBS4200036.1 signal peptidase I [Lederbergia citrisecunda]